MPGKVGPNFSNSSHKWILNMCPCLVKIRSVTSEIRRQKMKEERKTTSVKYKPFGIAMPCGLIMCMLQKCTFNDQISPVPVSGKWDIFTDLRVVYRYGCLGLPLCGISRRSVMIYWHSFHATSAADEWSLGFVYWLLVLNVAYHCMISDEAYVACISRPYVLKVGLIIDIINNIHVYGPN